MDPRIRLTPQATQAAAVSALWRAASAANPGLIRSGRLLSVGLLIQRKAVLTPDLNELETRVSDLFTQLDFERSCLSDFELRDRAEAEAAKRTLSAAAEGNVQMAKDGTVITAKDLMQRWTAEHQAVTLASRDAADPGLKRPALLLSTDADLCIPCCPVVREDASLRAACERLLDLIGLTDSCQLLGNAPAGLHTYKYKQSPVSLFLHRAIFTGADWRSAEASGSWKWVGADSLAGQVPNRRLLAKLRLLAAEF